MAIARSDGVSPLRVSTRIGRAIDALVHEVAREAPGTTALTIDGARLPIGAAGHVDHGVRSDARYGIEARAAEVVGELDAARRQRIERCEDRAIASAGGRHHQLFEVRRRDPHARVRRHHGLDDLELYLLQVMEGRRVFDDLNVDENLIAGAHTRKSRQDVTSCEVQLEAERAEEEPRVFTKIHAHFVIHGRNLSRKHVERAISLSAEKFCSASIMLGKTADITHDYEILEV